jgi:hypothetical protein
MNYLEMVNMGIRESGITDDPLTSFDFATADTRAPIYEKMKRWVNQGWGDIQLERDEWTWQTGTALVVLRPRIRFYDAADLGGGTFQGDAVTGETDVSLSLSPPIYFTGSTTEGYADVIGQPTASEPLGDDNSLYANLRMGESIYFPDKDTPSSTYRFFGWGEYNFLDQNEPLDTPLTDIGQIHQQTVQILSDRSEDTNGTALPYIPFSDWQFRFPQTFTNPSTPVAFTQNIQGKFIFNSGLDRPYRLKFNYTKKPQTLSTYNDIPQGLDVRFHEAIVWRALEKYGEYDSRPGVVARARKELMKFKRWQERSDLPNFHFDTTVRW